MFSINTRELEPDAHDIARITSIIEQADPDDIKAYLFYTFLNDERSLLRFRIMTEEEITADDMETLRGHIDLIRQRFGDLDEGESMEYAAEVYEYLDCEVPTLVRRGHIIEAFEVTNYILVNCCDPESMTDDYSFDWLADGCQDCWEKIYEKAGAEFRTEIARVMKNVVNGKKGEYDLTPEPGTSNYDIVENEIRGFIENMNL